MQRQFEKSHFFKNKQDEKPIKLAIFDFDSTLFFSPLLSPTLWHPNLIKLATAESVYGPGWWRDVRSLDLGPFEELKKTGWEGYWNEKTVKEARECIADPNTMTVVLTGRRFHPFHLLIPDMLEAKQLQFDLIGLRPDPEHVSDNHWKVRNGLKQLTYNLASSVFNSTMHFKTCFILNILHNVKSIQNVIMWDDRIHHVNRFKEYLSQLKYNRYITDGSVIYVPGIRPKYNPSWEINVIQHIIETHNKAVMEHNEGVRTGKCELRLTWPIVEKEDPLENSSSDLPLQLAKLPAATVLKLSKQDTDLLYKQYKPIFEKQLEYWRIRCEDLGGEEPVYFGKYVYISPKVIPSKSIRVGPIGSEVEVTVKYYSEMDRSTGLLLTVEVDQQEYILPLWFKPSEYAEVLKSYDVKWRSPKEKLVLKCKVDYEYRLGVEDKISVSKKRERELEPVVKDISKRKRSFDIAAPESVAPETKRTKT